MLRASAHDACRDFPAAIADLSAYIAQLEAAPKGAGPRPVFSAYSYRAHMHFSLGDYAAAVTDYSRAIDLAESPLWSDLYERGQARHHLGDTPGALADLRAALAQLDDTDPMREEISALMAHWQAP